MPTLSSIMAAVDAAPALNTARPQRWRPYYEAYRKLRAKGYSCEKAIKFFVEQGIVPAGDETKALNAFQCATARHNKKAKSRA